MDLGEYEIGSLSRGNSLLSTGQNSINLEKKMRAMQGYKFKHNRNYKAMKKVITNDHELTKKMFSVKGDDRNMHPNMILK